MLSAVAGWLLSTFVAQAAPVAAPTSEATPAASADPAQDELRRRLDDLTRRLAREEAEHEAERAEHAREAEEAAAQQAQSERPAVRLYGFADAGVQRMMPKSTSALNLTMPSRQTTFVLGNLNIYLDAQPSESWSALIETRLTNSPNGVLNTCSQLGPCVPESTAAIDPSSPVGWSRIRWGAIEIERAYLQWRYADLLQVRVGRFLTPFGIWNIDHGTPTLISLMIPNFLVNEMIPPALTGVEMLGATAFGDWTAGYHAHVSNGRTEGQIDFTDDKMFGGRVYLKRTYPLRLAFGLSGLTGRNTNMVPVVTSLIPYRVGRQEIYSYRESTGGADVSLDAGPLRLRGEFAIRRVDYKPGERETHYDVPNVFNANRLEWNTYVLAAYQLPFWGLEPFVYGEVYRVPTFLSEGALIPSVGFNIHFTSFAQLKVQYMMVHFTPLPDLFSGKNKDEDVHVVSARLVLAF